MLFLHPKQIFAQASLVSTNRYSLGMEFYGLAPYPNPSSGLRLGSLVGEDSEWELTHIQSRKEVLLANAKFLETSLRLKTFLNPFMHYSFGLGARNLNIEYEVSRSSHQEQEPVNEHHQAVIAQFGFGIELTLFEVITLGSDLMAFSVPLHWTKRVDKFPSDAEATEEDPKDLPFIVSGFSSHTQFLRTYLKVRF